MINKGTAKVVLSITMSAMLLLTIEKVAYASEDGAVFSSTLIVREDNPTEKPLYANVGEIVRLNGTITRTTNAYLNIELSLKSNSTQGKDWVLLDVQPGKNFTLSEPLEVGYEFKVQFLKEGSYYLRPWARIVGASNATLTHGPIDADSPSCRLCAGLGTTVIVSEQKENGGKNIGDRSFQSSIPLYIVVAVAAIGGGSIIAFYISRNRKRHSSSY